MPTFRYREEESSTATAVLSLAAGALAGFAAGVLVAQRVGGINGLTTGIRRRLGAFGILDVDAESEMDDDEIDEFEYEDEDEEFGESLEERVLEAFRNDPILSERAVDIGGIGDGIIELSGWVDEEEEAEHAVTVARGVPGVETVVNRLGVGEEEEILEDNVRRLEEGDPALNEAHWEGMRVGTGRRRQGTSAEADRHADPKPELEDRWLSEEEAVRNAADDSAGIAERRRASKRSRGGRADGSPVGPSGVPKGDHVADPEAAADEGRSS